MRKHVTLRALALFAALATTLSLSTCDFLSASLFGPALTYAQAWIDVKPFAEEADVRLPLDPYDGIAAKIVSMRDYETGKNYSRVALLVKGSGDSSVDYPYNTGLLDPYTLKIKEAYDRDDVMEELGEDVEVTDRIMHTAADQWAGVTFGDLVVKVKRNGDEDYNAIISSIVDGTNNSEKIQSYLDTLLVPGFVGGSLVGDEDNDTIYNLGLVLYVPNQGVGTLTKWQWEELDRGVIGPFALGGVSDNKFAVAFLRSSAEVIMARIYTDQINNNEGAYLSEFVVLKLNLTNIIEIKDMWISAERLILWAHEGETEKLIAYTFDGKNRADLILEGSSLHPLSFYQAVDGDWKHWLAYDAKSGRLFLNNPWWEQ